MAAWQGGLHRKVRCLLTRVPVDPNRRFHPAHGSRQQGTNVNGKVLSSFILTRWRETSKCRGGSTIRWIREMQIMSLRNLQHLLSY